MIFINVKIYLIIFTIHNDSLGGRTVLAQLPPALSQCALYRESRVCLLRGHWNLSHAATSSVSPSRATRWGFCGVKPRARIQVQRYRGLRWMPNSCWIGPVKRSPVHNSVANPCVAGSSVSQRRTT